MIQHQQYLSSKNMYNVGNLPKQYQIMYNIIYAEHIKRSTASATFPHCLGNIFKALILPEWYRQAAVSLDIKQVNLTLEYHACNGRVNVDFQFFTIKITATYNKLASKTRIRKYPKSSNNQDPRMEW